ncbi:hypothetical protein AVEN_131609-1 [Araneus ventricosus]|uniref:Uncharacterized protein n=1 Tax=Araneus ventricosus TaxID=182803 RepID=A0A4Y2ESL7_ARAVE|nr:hypothetical protein AVEN_131609-1 [Araneus ventricosus]
MLKYLSESSLDVSGVPYHANCTRPIPSTRLNSPLLTNRVYGLMMSSAYSYTCIRTIGNETRQTRQRVSNNQQSNGSFVGPRRGVKHCTVQSTTEHECTIGSESLY